MMSTTSGNGVDMDVELAQLLREQEQFLHHKKQPSAKVSRRGATPKVSGSKSSSNASESALDDGPQVLKGIVERQVTSVDHQSLVFVAKPSGFPAVTRRGPGQSLFGRRRREAAAITQVKQEEPMARDIDAVNQATLQGMSAQEIAEAQQELMRTLDPQLIEKLKNRRKKNDNKETKKSVEKDEKKTVVVREKVKEAEAEKEQQQKEETIRNLAAIKTEEDLKQQTELLPDEERAKLDWTRSIKEAKTSKQERGRKAARLAVEDATIERFDLDGKLLEATDAELPGHSGLFHHGDDPDAAGYTLPELLHLARSSVASQRAMSLHVVAKILRNRQLQTKAFVPVVPRVLPGNMAVTLRMVLDDQNYTALNAGVAALHAFIVPLEADPSSIDECFLTELKHGTIVLPPKVHLHRNGVKLQPKSSDYHAYEAQEVVYINTAETDDGTSISDEELAALDPVQALVRMDIGTRLRYILETIQLPDQHTIEKILEILLAVARHSPRAAHEISSNARLLKVLQQRYIENEDVLTFQEGTTRLLHLSLKALRLVRALCQGQRSIACTLIANGLIQSTKGFLALKGTPIGEDDDEAAALFAQIQVESLRIWRVLLGYGLDFHCFAYLFPILSSFTQDTTEVSSLRNSALFAALEAFCGLGAVHEAQHYFNQLGFFLDAAKDAATRLIGSLSKQISVKDVVLLSTVLRFLTAASAHVTKYNLKTNGLIQVLQLVQAHEMTQGLLPQLDASTAKRELLVALIRFHQQLVANNLLPDDVDDDEVVQTFSRKVQTPLLTAATFAATSSSGHLSLTLIQACELTLLLGDFIAAEQTDLNAEFVQHVYNQALILVERLGSGGEHLVARLFANVLFSQRVLLLLGVFKDEADAARMSRVLIPIYQALVTISAEQEAHSAQIFTGTSSTDKSSYHVRLPHEEQTFVPSNLPLPTFWMVCPLSRIEYSNSGDGKLATCVGPTRAQSDEMKLIVSATCRFVFEFERLEAKMSNLPSSAELRPEDKLFHLLHVFFAGSDVLFDDHVDAALRQLLPKLIQPIVRSPEDSRLLYEGIRRNLQRVQSLESGEVPESTLSHNAVSFSSDEHQVLTFVEKLLGEFTASSFGNSHFAHCVTLLMTRDFSLQVRKVVWKELQEAHLLHTLEPFEALNSQLFKRCIRGSATLAADSKLLLLMQQAVCKKQISPLRGAFAYSLAIHHIVIYLFEEGTNKTLSVARQQFAQTLATEASPVVWGHLLSYDISKNVSLLTEDHVGTVSSERISKLRTQAAYSSEQLVAFDASVSLLGQD